MPKENIKKHLQNLLKQEIRAVSGLSRLLGKDLERALDSLSRAEGKLVISGVGKSGHIGVKIAATMTSLGIPAVFMHPAEALHGDLGIVGKDDALIAISYSGNAKELLKIISHVKRHGVPVVAITGNARSPLARASDSTLAFSIAQEGSPFNLAPMASTTATLVVGDLLATALCLKRGFTKKDFADVHPAGSLGLQLTPVGELMQTGSKMPMVKENQPLQRALKEITAKKLGITGVVNASGRLIGVVSDGDVRRFLMSGKFSERSLVRDAMTRKPKVIDADSSLQDAISLMEKRKITSLFVLRSGKPVGVLHMHQIVERQLV